VKIKLDFWNTTCRCRVAVLSVATVISVLVTSCGGSNTTNRVVLDFASGNSDSSAENMIETFAEDDSVVLRCASLIKSELGIVLEVSKSKAMKTNYLIYVRTADKAGVNDSALVAATRVTGEEYEYDISQSSFYFVTRSSAEKAVAEYGIGFSDWLAGATSNSEQFPCCESR
jgi:hypothetical protein